MGVDDPVPQAEIMLAVNDALGEYVLLVLTEEDTLEDAEGLREPLGDAHADAVIEGEGVPVDDRHSEGLPLGDGVLDSVELAVRPPVLLREPELEALAQRVVLRVTEGEVDALAHREALLVKVPEALALSDAMEADTVAEAPTLAEARLRVPHGEADALGLPLLLGEGEMLGETLADTLMLTVAAALGRVDIVEVEDTERVTDADCASDDDG